MSTEFMELNNMDVAIINAMRQAQTDSGSEIDALSGVDPQDITWTTEDPVVQRTGTTSLESIISDATTVDNVTWEDLKSTALADGYYESADFTDLSVFGKQIVAQLISAQNNHADGVDAPLVMVSS